MNPARILSRSATLAVGVVLALGAAAPAVATDRTTDEFVQLARDARSDPTAEGALFETTSIDGRPVDVSWILGDEATRRHRLEALVTAEAPAPHLGAAELIASILAEERFETTGGVPAATVVQAWLLRVVQRVLTALEQSIPGGLATVGWVLLLGAVGGLGAVAWSLLRRRERAIAQADQVVGRVDRSRPAALERRAAEAEREGRLEEAIRLRFLAALLRLDAHGALRFHDGITSGQVQDALTHDLVPRLVGTHDEVVYGGRPATETDVRESRSGWPRVVSEVTP